MSNFDVRDASQPFSYSKFCKTIVNSIKFTKKNIIIIASVSVGVLLIGSLLFYFLFPSINPEKFEETVQQVEEQNALIAAENESNKSQSGNISNTDIKTIEARYNSKIDSMKTLLTELNLEKNEYLTQKTDLAEKVKSLENDLNQLREYKTNFEIKMEAHKKFEEEINRYSFNWTTGGQFSKKKIDNMN